MNLKKNMHKYVLNLCLCTILVLTGCKGAQSKTTTNTSSVEAKTSVTAENKAASNSGGKASSTTAEQKLLGGMTPEAALKYMETTPNLVIVQVNTAQWKITPGFTGALWIPHDEMAKRYDEIPRGCPVILHCGAGVVSVPAYETLKEKRKDIPELSYIAGSPHGIMKEYNEWLKKAESEKRK